MNRSNFLHDSRDRIQYGKIVDNDSSKMPFSLEPTLRFVLHNYLLQNHNEDVADMKLAHITDYQLVKLFVDIANTDTTVTNHMYEIYQAISDFRTVTLYERHGMETKDGKVKKPSDYYLNHRKP